MHRATRLLSAPAALVCALFAGCTDAPPSGPGPDDELAAIRVSANVLNTPIDLLVIEVSAADLPSNAVFNLPVVEGVATGTLRIPPGPARTFFVTAYDEAGEITHEGSAVRDVNRGPNPTLAIPLTPRSGQVPVTITFGSFSVEVTPSSAVIDLTMGQTLQLMAEVYDTEGALLVDPDVTWATTNPAIARVDATGLVTGLLEGDVQIVAMYDGVAGVSALTFTGTLPDLWYFDSDGDGYGDDGTGVAVPLGDPPPAGYVPTGGDCDDAQASMFPGAPEELDGVDNDCDGMIDEQVYWQDQDGDGYGDPMFQQEFESPPAGWVSAGPFDCNDLDPLINPGSVEFAGDGVDSDCDGNDG